MYKDLWVEPATVHFDHKQESQLVATLESMDRGLLMLPINTADDVRLDIDGSLTISGIKYRLTRWALLQLCLLACSGLYNFVEELAGVHRTSDSPREEYSFDEAVDILNKVLQRRYRTRLSGKVAILNTAQKTIDGYVSTAYKLMPNRELYSRAKEATHQSANIRFLEATLTGRWLLVRFVDTTPCLSFQHGEIEERFFSGYHFSNNEVGKASLAVAHLFYRKFSKSASIYTVGNNTGQLRHSGTKFADKFTALIHNVMSHPLRVEECRKGIERMQSTMLGLGHRDKQIENKRLASVAARLARKDVHASVARAIVSQLTRQGSYDEMPTEIALFRRSDRSVYDLYTAMGRHATTLPINHREQAEKAAHSVLRDEISFS
jgi:hypothetical protein